ncbi:MAG: DUF1573 domain-containing protein [Candidatus Omnitrophota bacterium]|nr:DUF1573 domain-containing protein [Candidatus Omnitrophota bacterium]
MKAYIEALLEMGVGKEDVFYKVAKKFSPNLILDDKIKSQVEQKLVQESGGKMPQAVLEAATFNLGTVSKKQGTIGKVFKLFNRGNDILVAKNLKTSCPCVTAALKMGKTKSPYFGTTGAPADWQVQVNPGKSAEIEAVIDLNHRTVSVGKLIREVYINTNDLLNPEITIKLEVEVTD